MLLRSAGSRVRSIYIVYRNLCIGCRTAFRFPSHRLIGLVIFALCAIKFLCIPASTNAYSNEQKESFQQSIIDYRRMVNPKFRKIKRKKTKYIIVHTSEVNLQTTLLVVSKGKRKNRRWISNGGHANYVIARDGRTFRTLDKKFKANHAGRSMWNGETHISDVSIGIEMVGNHFQKITDQQYKSVGILIDILQGVYRLNDLAVLTHSQVAYGNPHHWVRGKHRGRKYCAMNFVRSKAGLRSGWSFDPDVRAGRLLSDPTLAAVYYKKQSNAARYPIFNTITSNNTAWSIAGQNYNKKNTIYFLPSGRVKTGNQIIDWHYLPADTKIIVGYRGPFKVTSSNPPSKIAGSSYNDKRTIYYLPNNKLISGDKIKNFRRLPRNVFIFLPL